MNWLVRRDSCDTRGRSASAIGPIPTFYLTAEFDMEKAAEAGRKALEIAADICIYTNRNITVLELNGSEK
mgnify:CR=1 FL=1